MTLMEMIGGLVSGRALIQDSRATDTDRLRVEMLWLAGMVDIERKYAPQSGEDADFITWRHGAPIPTHPVIERRK